MAIASGNLISAKPVRPACWHDRSRSSRGRLWTDEVPMVEQLAAGELQEAVPSAGDRVAASLGSALGGVNVGRTGRRATIRAAEKHPFRPGHGRRGKLGGRLAALLAPRFQVLAGVRRQPAPPARMRSPWSWRTRHRWTGRWAAWARWSTARLWPTPTRASAIRGRATPERLGLRVLARTCAARGLRLIAISTDLVFSGERPVLARDRRHAAGFGVRPHQARGRAGGARAVPGAPRSGGWRS